MNVYVYRVHFAEFVERGSLYDFIHHNELDPERNLKWTKGIASGMALLHVSTIVSHMLLSVGQAHVGSSLWQYH